MFLAVYSLAISLTGQVCVQKAREAKSKRARSAAAPSAAKAVTARKSTGNKSFDTLQQKLAGKVKRVRQ
jgi:hypothetical protein